MMGGSSRIASFRLVQGTTTIAVVWPTLNLRIIYQQASIKDHKGLLETLGANKTMEAEDLTKAQISTELEPRDWARQDLDLTYFSYILD